MTLEEKAGLMFHPPIGDRAPTATLLEGPSASSAAMERPASSSLERHLNHFNIYATPEPRAARRVAQPAAAARRDDAARHPGDDLLRPAPRASTRTPARAGRPAAFSQWPEPIGLRRAPRDEELVRGFGDIARQEYRAVGIHVALHPMADLATEPRWARIVRHVRRGRRARRRA